MTTTAAATSLKWFRVAGVLDDNNGWDASYVDTTGRFEITRVWGGGMGTRLSAVEFVLVDHTPSKNQNDTETFSKRLRDVKACAEGIIATGHLAHPFE